MEIIYDLLWWVVVLYIIPTIIVVLFCFLNGENPFSKHVVDKTVVFMPGKNLIVVSIIIFAIIPDKIAMIIINILEIWKKKKEE